MFCISLAGETCGSTWDECDGISSYTLYAIIFGSVCLLSACIRYCMRSSTNSRQPIRRRVPPSVQSSGQRPAQVHSVGINSATQSPPTVVVHNIRESAPPSYAEAIASTVLIPKN